MSFRISAAILISALFISPVSAEQRIVEADGEYVISYSFEESFAAASERARAEAIRNASNQAGIYVESISEIQDLVLTYDQVRAISTNVLQIQGEPKIWMEPIADGKSARIRCHVTALVDDENITSIFRDSRLSLDDAVRKNKELEEKNAELNAELERLKQKYESVSTESERKQILEQVKINDNQFSANQKL